MKEYKYILICAVFLLFGIGTACSSDEPSPDGPDEKPEEPKVEVQFSVSLNGLEMTKANVEGTEFVEGNTFKLFFNTSKPSSNANADSTRVYTLDSSKEWGTTSPMYWDNQVVRYRDICAITLYDQTYEVTDTKTDYFTVKQDQSEEANYLNSDLLIARTQTNKRLIALPFYHMMSRIQVNVAASTKADNPDGWFSVNDFTGLKLFLNNMYLKGSIQYGDQPTETAHDITVTALDEIEKDITMHPLPEYPKVNEANDSVFYSYIAVIPPRAFFAKDVLLSAQIAGEGGKTYLFKPGASVENFTQQGYQTNINIVLKKTDIITEMVGTEISIVPWDATITMTDDDPIKLK